MCKEGHDTLSIDDILRVGDKDLAPDMCSSRFISAHIHLYTPYEVIFLLVQLHQIIRSCSSGNTSFKLNVMRIKKRGNYSSD